MHMLITEQELNLANMSLFIKFYENPEFLGQSGTDLDREQIQVWIQTFS